ncbi:hypothetical protein [Bacillus sp. FJAT-49736]|uniref:hypothetical protein n=1 Tax=Bacillus sp. FJAT-49736 TaxID=2833582 RepID=UPI001BC96D98|nr:hypothetical protein [Bacillus sp. FJAT-49736]MBS4173511.1 hypothetical protein [Bacillus sp. FJAT-49736]
MALKLIHVTDDHHGGKVTVNVDKIVYFFGMGNTTHIQFDGHFIFVKESYTDIQCMLQNII